MSVPVEVVVLEVLALASAAGLAAARAHVIDARRRERLARISHELRGPLQAAMLGLSWAERAPHDTGTPLRAIERELARAVLAVEDLDVARGATDAVPSRGLVDVDRLLRDQVAAWQPVADARGREVVLTRAAGPEHTQPTVQADARRLAQATGNLIANGLEHGLGTVRLRTEVQEGRVRIEVRDAGPGLAYPLRQLVAGPRRGHGSRGRGLAIADAVARELGGRLVAVNAADGCRLVLDLPAAEGHAAASNAAPLVSGASRSVTSRSVTSLAAPPVSAVSLPAPR